MRYHTQLKINLLSLERNISKLRKISNENQIIFMVKANAYGHGLGRISQFVSNELDIKELGCASLGEAIYLRRNYPNISSKVIVFSDTNLTDTSLHELYLDYNIIPVIHNMTDLKLFLNERSFQYCPLYLKFDTGMNRLGLNFSELKDAMSLIKKSGRKTIDHLMTHFSSSYIKFKEGDKTDRQYQEFLKIKREFINNNFEVINSSVSNSGAIEQRIGLDESHIRPGLMLYGPSSLMGQTNKNTAWGGECISSFETQILKVMKINKGMPVGYGNHICGKSGILVYLPIGYGDGVLTYLSGSKVKYRGHVGSIIGRINMDLTCVLFDSEALSDLRTGASFNLWTHDASDISSLAHQSKTIPYQLFCGVSNRVSREYYSS